ncbi:MAG: MFS transporter [bacterium]
MAGGPVTDSDRLGGHSPLLVVFVTVFIDLLGFGIIIPILPFYAQDFGASELVVGMLFASYSLMQFLFSPLWGRVSDVLGRRPVLLVSLFGTSLSFFIFGLAKTLTVLFIGRIAAGVFGAVITTAYAYIADVTTPGNRAHGMGIIGAAFGLGFIFGPFIGGVMADAWGYAAPAYFAAVLALANGILALFVFPESYPPEVRERDRTSGAPRRTLSLVRLWGALKHPAVGSLLLLYFLVTFAFANMEATYALLTEDLFGWGARENGWVFAYIGVVMVVVQGWLIRPLSRRFGERKLVVAGTVALIPGLGLLPWSPGPAVLLVLSGIMALASGLNTPSITSLISQGAEEREQGAMMGMNQSMGSLARFVGPAWGGFTFETLGRSAPYWTAALLMAAASVLALRLHRRHRDDG